MSQLDTLQKNLQNLAEQLEEMPDAWFNCPSGYLFKPDFKREQQTKEHISSGKGTGIFARLTGSAFKKRWFVLSVNERKLRYYENEELTDIKGAIDLNYIDDVDYSHVQDAGNNSIDLIAYNQHYTLQAESAVEMYRWALAIKRCLNKHAMDSHSAALDQVETAPSYSRESMSHHTNSDFQEKWYRYDHTYEEPGPIYMNVMGSANKDAQGKVLNSWVIVTAFEPTPDGTPGRSEASGVISVKDYVVGVNGTDLTTCTFNEAMDCIGKAAFPKTLHFLRDNDATKAATRIESWAVVHYPALHQRRRRYCEVRQNMINFRKPAPGGSACAERDAFFLIDHIKVVVPLNDLNSPEDQQFVLQMHCKENSTVEHIGADDKSVGGSPISVLELCFANEKSMNQWRSMLISPTIYNGNTQLSTEPMRKIAVGEEIEHSSAHRSENEETTVLLTSDDLAIKSTLTGNLTLRKFEVTSDGHIWWERHARKGHAIASTMKRKLFVANGKTCDILSIFAEKCELGELGGKKFAYQLGIQTKQSSVIICFPVEKEAVMLEWLAVIKKFVSLSPKLVVPDGLVIPSEVSTSTTNQYGVAEGGEYYDVTGGSSSANANDEDFLDVFQGYLYKRNDLLLPKGFSPQAAFAKVYMVLKDGYVYIFHSQIEATSGVLPFTSIPLGEVIEAREATDAGVPENSFEVVTVDKVYMFSATDEDSLTLWMDAISDLLEARDVVVQKIKSDGNPGTVIAPGTDAYVQTIKSSILFSGGLTMKSVNLITGFATWRDRHVVITSSSLSYYNDAKDVYVQDASPINEVSLFNITDLRTCNHNRETRCKERCAFELTAFVSKGGDEDGCRVFVFEARTPELCKQWMEEICNATNKYELANADREGFFIAIKSEAQENKRLAFTAAGLAGGAGVVAPGNVMLRRTSVMAGRGGRGGRGGQGRGGQGRGGQGRGAAFAAGRGSTIARAVPAESSKGETPKQLDDGTSIQEKTNAAQPATQAAGRGPTRAGSIAGGGSGRGPGVGGPKPPGRGGMPGRGRGFRPPGNVSVPPPKPALAEESQE